MFLKNLKEDKEAYKSYVLGGGSETIEKYIKRGKTYNPPKMAAVASSSRFIYSTFKDKKYKDKISKIVGDILDGEFRFEHILPFKNVSKSFLDGSYISKDKAVFLEAKCHEIFDKHKIILRKAYYESGLLTSDNDFSLQISNVILKDKTVEINKCEFNLDEDEELLLDVKQFITHLFGIANYNLPNTKKELGIFQALLFYSESGFIVGNNNTSRIDAESVRSITRRSTPKPRPPVGARPYSRAVT